MSEKIYCKTIRYFCAFANEVDGEDIEWVEAALLTTCYVVPYVTSNSKLCLRPLSHAGYISLID
jgi:hypothetical protein